MKRNGTALFLNWKVVLISALSFFLTMNMGNGIGQAIAADEDSDKVNLEQMVVTATRSKKSAEEVTADVDVVTEAEIEAAAANNVDDVLRRLGGVDIRRPSDFGITSPIDISIRGVGGTKRVLFLVDGVPTNSAITGMVYPNQVQLSSLKQMEVVKGPFSSLYGSNAMGGVINFITKERETEGLDITPMVKTGNFGLFESGLGLEGREGAMVYTLNASYRQIDNHYRRDENVNYSFNPMTGEFDKSHTPVNDHAGYDDYRFFGKLSYDVSDETRITVSGNFVQTDTENGSTRYQMVPKDRDTEHTFYFANLNGETVVNDKFDIDFRLYTNYTETDATTEHIERDPNAGGGPPMGPGGPMGGAFNYIYGQRLHSGRDTGIQLKAGTTLGEHHYFIAGIDSNFIEGKWDNKNEDGSLIGEAMDESLNNQAIYLQNESEFFSSLFLTLGFRYDINSISDDSLSPKVGILYRLNERIDLRGSVGRAYRAPNLNELYTPTWMMVPGVPFESNPDLEPEVVWSYDLGTKIQLTDQLNFNFTGFYSKAEDLISNPITNGVMRYENMDEVETDGFETGIDGKILSWLGFYLNYTYTHSVEKGGGRLDNQSLHQANGGVMATYMVSSQAKLTGTFDLRYNGEMAFTDRMSRQSIELDEWIVADLGLRLTLFDRLGIQCAVTNLFEEEYEIHGSNLGPERAYWIGADYTF